jgi:hypothetical protein
MPTTVPSGGNSAIASHLYNGRIETIKTKVLIGADTNPIATEFEVNKRFLGTYFINARFRGVGGLPSGISWEADDSGIRFYGVPQAIGTYHALFEGPYPDNFVGTSSSGACSRDPCRPVCLPTAQLPSPGIQKIQVFGWVIKFIITPKSANSLSLGQVIKQLRQAPYDQNKYIYREGWIA